MAPSGALGDEWLIGLSAWIIQDGNYGDFSVGQRAEFALEFYAREALKSGNRFSCSSTWRRASSPMTRWKFRTITG